MVYVVPPIEVYILYNRLYHSGYPKDMTYILNRLHAINEMYKHLGDDILTNATIDTLLRSIFNSTYKFNKAYDIEEYNFQYHSNNELLEAIFEYIVNILHIDQRYVPILEYIGDKNLIKITTTPIEE